MTWWRLQEIERTIVNISSALVIFPKINNSIFFAPPHQRRIVFLSIRYEAPGAHISFTKQYYSSLIHWLRLEEKEKQRRYCNAEIISRMQRKKIFMHKQLKVLGCRCKLLRLLSQIPTKHSLCCAADMRVFFICNNFLQYSAAKKCAYNKKIWIFYAFLRRFLTKTYGLPVFNALF